MRRRIAIEAIVLAFAIMVAVGALVVIDGQNELYAEELSQ